MESSDWNSIRTWHYQFEIWKQNILSAVGRMNWNEKIILAETQVQEARVVYEIKNINLG